MMFLALLSCENKQNLVVNENEKESSTQSLTKVRNYVKSDSGYNNRPGRKKIASEGASDIYKSRLQK